MKCFNHHDRDAFGVCQSCGKALCLECIDMANNSVKCKHNPACIERAKIMNISYRNLCSSYSKSQRVMALIIGILFFAPGVTGTIVSLIRQDDYMLIVSLIFVSIGFAIIQRARNLFIK